MKWLAAAALLTLAIGCTRPNPRSCADGTCSDPALPFCDTDGSFSGYPDSCIAVTCEPGVVEACRSDGALICDEQGTNYDIVACDARCDVPRGCVECLDSTDCPTERPVCDAESGSCTECTADDQCMSEVCSRGVCEDGMNIVYAAPDGSAAANCTLKDPCTPSRVLELAAAENGARTVRMLPGIYATTVSVGVATTAPIRIVASGARFENTERATPSGTLPTDHDHDGMPRPQGAGFDIGAFEQ